MDNLGMEAPLPAQHRHTSARNRITRQIHQCWIKSPALLDNGSLCVGDRILMGNLGMEALEVEPTTPVMVP